MITPKRVLIITPNWPPVSCPDLHRVRMALPYFAEFGWEPLILKINPAEQEGIKDPDLCRTVPDHIKTWQSGCLPLWLTKWTGLRNVGLRSYFHLVRLGDRIIQQEKPQVVFFSTTMFALMTLGRYWRWRHGIPYVLDFQDPWLKEKQKAETGKAEIRDYGTTGNGTARPEFMRLSEATARQGSQKSVVNGQSSVVTGHGMKRRLADRVAGILEPFALRRAAQVVSVSPAYVDMLCARYSWLDESDFTVLPFGAAEADYELLRASPVQQNIFNLRDGRRHWVYAGRGGGDMAFSLKSFFLALKRMLSLQPKLRKDLCVHFIGTNYAPKERAAKTVEPVASEFGLSDIVSEITDRIPYFEALQCLLDADALFIPGSDDPGYTASKIYPYILAKKPLLAVFHEASSVVRILNLTKAGTVVTFRNGESVEATAGRITATGWLDRPTLPLTDWSAFEPYMAREMTRRLCEVFQKTITGKS